MEKFAVVIPFESAGIVTAEFNGMKVRDADHIVKTIVFETMLTEYDGLQESDFDCFTFEVDWLKHEVAVTEND